MGEFTIQRGKLCSFCFLEAKEYLTKIKNLCFFPAFIGIFFGGGEWWVLGEELPAQRGELFDFRFLEIKGIFN